MSKDRKKKKLTDNGQLTIGGVDFSLSIGNILGKGYSADEKTAWERQSKEREPADGLGKMTSALARLAKITLHRQSSGKGGKIVTIVTLSKESAFDIEELAKELRKGLGCGSRVENGKVVLQGDIQDRVREWFAKKGVKQIVLGN